MARAVAESRLGPKHAELQEWSLLAAFLAEQALALERGDDGGVFATYVRALPRRTGGVLDWPEADVASLLAGSPSLRAARDRQESVEAAIAEIRASFPQLTPGALRWAFDVLFSRLIRLPSRGGELALEPWADMLNHKPGCAAYIDDAGGAVCLRPDRRYRPGEQVFASAGARPSSELLISYGFAPPVGENPDDSTSSRSAWTPRTGTPTPKPPHCARWGWSCGGAPLRRAGTPSSPAVRLVHPVRPRGRERLPELAARAAGNKALGGVLARHPRQARDQGEVLGGAAGETAVREMLADLTTDALARYPTTLERDRDIAAQDPSKPAAAKREEERPAAELIPDEKEERVRKRRRVPGCRRVGGGVFRAGAPDAARRRRARARRRAAHPRQDGLGGASAAAEDESGRHDQVRGEESD